MLQWKPVMTGALWCCSIKQNMMKRYFDILLQSLDLKWFIRKGKKQPCFVCITFIEKTPDKMGNYNDVGTDAKETVL